MCGDDHYGTPELHQQHLHKFDLKMDLNWTEKTLNECENILYF